MVTLREVFEELAGGGHPDPAAVLREHGFDLPDAELRYALVSYAHSAPVDVAGHLQPYVMANSPVSWEDTPEVATLADGLGLLTTAPTPDATPEDPTADLDDLPAITGAAGGALTSAGTEAASDLLDGGAEPASGQLADVGPDAAADRLDFGGGADAAVGPGAGPDPGAAAANEDWPALGGGAAGAGTDPAGAGGPHPLDPGDHAWGTTDEDLFGTDAVGGEPFGSEPAPQPPGDGDEAGGGDTDLIGP